MRSRDGNKLTELKFRLVKGRRRRAPAGNFDLLLACEVEQVSHGVED